MAKNKQKRKKKGWIIALAIVAVLVAAFFIGWNWLAKEHAEIRSIEFDEIDFAQIEDGVYEGYYAGGLYGWRENSVSVTVEDGKVTSIELLYSKDGVPPEITDELYMRVVDAQKLDVDTVSEATLTSKAYLKSVEDALLAGGN